MAWILSAGLRHHRLTGPTRFLHVKQRGDSHSIEAMRHVLVVGIPLSLAIWGLLLLAIV